MSTLYITEYVSCPFINGNIPVGAEPGTDQTPVTISGSHAESAALKNNTQLVRLHTDTVCSVVFSVAGATAATTSSRRMAANQTEYVGVSPNSGLKISVIANT